MKNLKNRIFGILILIGTFSVLGGSLFLIIYKGFTDNNKPTPPKIKPIWSVEIETYDSVSNKMKRYYSKVLMREDTIRKIWLSDGKSVDSTSFLTSAESNNCGVSEITAKGGTHYKITILINGICTDKRKLDSAYRSIDFDINNPNYQQNNDNN